MDMTTLNSTKCNVDFNSYLFLIEILIQVELVTLNIIFRSYVLQFTIWYWTIFNIILYLLHCRIDPIIPFKIKLFISAFNLPAIFSVNSKNSFHHLWISANTIFFNWTKFWVNSFTKFFVQCKCIKICTGKFGFV